MQKHAGFGLNSLYARQVLFSIFCLAYFFSDAQNPALSWVSPIFGTATKLAMSVTADPTGSVYSTGTFRDGVIDVDPGPGVHTLPAYFYPSAYLVKQDPSGNLAWAIKAGSSFCKAEGHQVACDPEGNVYYSGRYSGVVDFDPGFANFDLSSLAFSVVPKDVFVVKLNRDGNLIWARSFGALFAYINSYDLIVDRFQNVYLAGIFTGKMDFDPSPAFDTLLSHKGAGFLVKLNPGGNLVRTLQFHANANAYPLDYLPMKGSADKYGNILIGGTFSGTKDLDPGPTNFTATSVTIRDDFILKLDSSGNFIWVRQFQNNLINSDFSMAVDSNGNIYKSGVFSGTLDFAPGPFQTTISAQGPSSIYYQRLRPDGYLDWVKQIGQGTEKVRKIWTDRRGNLYTLGTFSAILEFDQGFSNVTLTPNFAGWGTYISRVDKYGKFIWAFQPGEGSEYVGLKSGHTDLNGNLLCTGSFMNTVDFEPGPGVTNLIADNNDIFVTKLFQCPPADTILTIAACYSYQLNNQLYTNNGTYHQFLTSAEGCDSLLTLNLLINTIDLTVINNGFSLFAADSSLSCQWVDCDNGFAPIPGATQDTFAPQVNGHYAMIASAHGCADTSACYPITTVGSPVMAGEMPVILYPNPTSGRFFIKPWNKSAAIEIEITDIYGKQVLKRHYSHENSMEFTLEGPAGMYFARIVIEGKRRMVKVVKVTGDG